MSKGLTFLASLILCLLAAGTARAATMEVYVLVWNIGNIERHTLTVRWDGATLRIDHPDVPFAALYHEKDETFIGLELRDAQYWKFNWPALSRTLHRQRESSEKLRQNLITGDNAASLLGNARTPSHEETPVEIAWAPGKSPSTWTGTGSPRGTIELVAGPASAAVTAFWQRFAKAQDILRTVAVRELAPGDLLPLISSLPPAASAPAFLRWTRNGEVAESLRLAKVRTDPLDPALFVPPPVYRETKLSTIDGISDDNGAPP